MVYFEYNAGKSKANKDKHGIDFEEAKALWEDDDHVEVDLDSYPESRYAVPGKIQGLFYTAIVTYRNEHIRIISVRRARRKGDKTI